MSEELNVSALNSLIATSQQMANTINGMLVWKGTVDTDIVLLKQFMDEQKQTNTFLAESITLKKGEKKKLSARTNERIYKVLKLSADKHGWTREDHRKYIACFGRFRARLYADMHKRFDVSSYDEIPRKDFMIATDFADTWVPSTNTEELIDWCYGQAIAQGKIKDE